MLASLFAVVMIAGGALAQEELVPRLGPFVPRYAVGAGLDHETVDALALSPLASPPLTIWNGSFKLRKKKFPFKMVGDRSGERLSHDHHQYPDRTAHLPGPRHHA